MSRTIDLWLRRAKLWGPALAFLLVNLGLLLGYRVLVQARVAAVTDDARRQEQELAELVELRQDRERLLTTAQSTEEAIASLRSEGLGTEAAGLTRIMSRVKELLTRAGLSGPRSITYSEQPLPEYGLVVKQIAFGFQGSYEQLRRFINFLELSESFLTVEEIAVSEGEDGTLSVRLRLSTLFDAPELLARGSA